MWLRQLAGVLRCGRWLSALGTVPRTMPGPIERPEGVTRALLDAGFFVLTPHEHHNKNMTGPDDGGRTRMTPNFDESARNYVRVDTPLSRLKSSSAGV